MSIIILLICVYCITYFGLTQVEKLGYKTVKGYRAANKRKANRYYRRFL